MWSVELRDWIRSYLLLCPILKTPTPSDSAASPCAQ